MIRRRDRMSFLNKAAARDIQSGRQHIILPVTARVDGKNLNALSLLGGRSTHFTITDNSGQDRRQFNGPITVHGGANFGNTNGGNVAISGDRMEVDDGRNSNPQGLVSNKKHKQDLREVGLDALAERNKKLKPDEKAEALLAFQDLLPYAPLFEGIQELFGSFFEGCA